MIVIGTKLLGCLSNLVGSDHVSSHQNSQNHQIYWTYWAYWAFILHCFWKVPVESEFTGSSFNQERKSPALCCFLASNMGIPMESQIIRSTLAHHTICPQTSTSLSSLKNQTTTSQAEQSKLSSHPDIGQPLEACSYCGSQGTAIAINGPRCLTSTL